MKIRWRFQFVLYVLWGTLQHNPWKIDCPIICGKYTLKLQVYRHCLHRCSYHRCSICHVILSWIQEYHPFVRCWILTGYLRAWRYLIVIWCDTIIITHDIYRFSRTRKCILDMYIYNCLYSYCHKVITNSIQYICAIGTKSYNGTCEVFQK